jgi:peptide/nickel transport system permease protein
VRPAARCGWLAAGLIAVAFVAFALPARVPGGSEDAFLGARAGDPIARFALRHDLHLTSSPPAGFLRFVGDAAHGDLGYSWVSGVDVGTVVGERLLASLALAFAAAAIGVALVPIRRGPRARAPAPSAVPGALWALPLVCAVAVAAQFGALPSVGPHSSIIARVGASLLPAATLGVAFAVWRAIARRTARDVLTALLVGTLVTEVVFRLPGLGSLLAAAATRPDLLVARGALLAIAVVAVVAEVAFVPDGHVVNELTDPRSLRRRTANGLVATIWMLALMVAILGRAAFGLGSGSHASTTIGAGLSFAHPFGTDVLGRDVLVRVLATARGSLLLVVAAMLIASVFGVVVGALVGFTNGRLERIGLAMLSGWAGFPGEIVAVALLLFNGRSGSQAALALAFVAAPMIAAGAQRRWSDAIRRSDARLTSGRWLRDVATSAVPGATPAALAMLFVGASRVLVAELVAGFLGVGPAATQTWSHEIVAQLPFAATAPWAVVAPVAVALVTAVALAGLGNAIRSEPKRDSVAGKTKDALGEDVLVDLRGAAGDRERA